MKNLVKITVSGNIQRAAAEVVDRRLPYATQRLMDEVLRSCEPYVPYRTGELCRSASAVRDGSPGGHIVYSAGHASRCYYAEHPFSRKYHPRACARWFEAAKLCDMKKWTDTAADALSDNPSLSFGGI